MKPYEFDSSNFRKKAPVRNFCHRHKVAGRLFGAIGLVLVLPMHAIAGAVMAIRDNGVDEFLILLRMVFGPWRDRATLPRSSSLPTIPPAHLDSQVGRTAEGGASARR